MAGGAGGAVGNAVVIDAALAGFGPGGGIILKANLRSQNMLFTLHPMPLFVGPATTAVVGTTKPFIQDAHGGFPYGGDIL